MWQKRYRKEKLLKVVFYFQQMEDCISVKTFQAHNKKLNRLVANADRVFISIDFITRQRFHYQQYKQWLVLCVDIYFIPILFGNTKNSDTRRHFALWKLYFNIPRMQHYSFNMKLKICMSNFSFWSSSACLFYVEGYKGQTEPFDTKYEQDVISCKRYNTNIFCNSQFVGLDHIILIM